MVQSKEHQISSFKRKKIISLIHLHLWHSSFPFKDLVRDGEKNEGNIFHPLAGYILRCKLYFNCSSISDAH